MNVGATRHRKQVAVNVRRISRTPSPDVANAKNDLIRILRSIKTHVPADVKTWPCFGIQTTDPLSDSLKVDLKALSLWLRMQPDTGPIVDDLGNLHYYMRCLAIDVVPFLNPGYENKLALEKRLPEQLLPKKESTVAGWKENTCTDQEARKKAGFLKSEATDGHNTASVGIYLEDLDNAVRQQTTTTAPSHNRLVLSGLADVQKRSDVELDHIDPFSSINTRITVFLKFMNQEGASHPKLKEEIGRYRDYFVCEDNAVLGTEYLVRSHYNCIDNLWFLEHGPNRDKSNKDPISWIEKHDFFKALIPYITNSNDASGDLSMKDCMDMDSFIYALGHADVLKEEFQGQMLGSVIRAFVWSQPEALQRLVRGAESLEDIKHVLSSVSQLFYADAIDQEDKDRIHTLFENMIGQITRNTHEIKKGFWTDVKTILHSPELKSLRDKLALTPTPQRKSRSRSDSGSSNDEFQGVTNSNFKVQFEAAARDADLEKRRADMEFEKRKAAELTISAQQQQLLEKDITILEERRAKEASDAKAEEARAKAEEASAKAEEARAKAEKLAAYLRTHGIDPDTL